MAYKEFVLTATSPAAASTVAGTLEIDNLDTFDWFTITAKLTGATGGTLDVYLQRWVGGLNEWQDWVHFTQLAAAASAVRYVMDSRMAATSIATVGSGTSPAIAAGTMACSHPGKKARLLFTAGASTSAGAAQTVIIHGWQSR